MAKEVIPQMLGFGGAALDSRLRRILVELQGLRISVATGAAPATDIAVAGITPQDTIVAVLRFVGAASATPNVTTVEDVTGEASILSPGSVRLSATDTSQDKLVVVWLDKQP